MEDDIENGQGEEERQQRNSERKRPKKKKSKKHRRHDSRTGHSRTDESLDTTERVANNVRGDSTASSFPQEVPWDNVNEEMHSRVHRHSPERQRPKKKKSKKHHHHRHGSRTGHSDTESLETAEQIVNNVGEDSTASSLPQQVPWDNPNEEMQSRRPVRISSMVSDESMSRKSHLDNESGRHRSQESGVSLENQTSSFMGFAEEPINNATFRPRFPVAHEDPPGAYDVADGNTIRVRPGNLPPNLDPPGDNLHSDGIIQNDPNQPDEELISAQVVDPNENRQMLREEIRNALEDLEQPAQQNPPPIVHAVLDVPEPDQPGQPDPFWNRWRWVLVCGIVLVILLIAGLSVGLIMAFARPVDAPTPAVSATGPPGGSPSPTVTSSPPSPESTDDPTFPPVVEPTDPEETPPPSLRPTMRNTPSPSPPPSNAPAPPSTFPPTVGSALLPTVTPTFSITPAPSVPPTARPTPAPTSVPPTTRPTPRPSEPPTIRPTRRATVSPTRSPTPEPTPFPTHRPTESPTPSPTQQPISPPAPLVSVEQSDLNCVFGGCFDLDRDVNCYSFFDIPNTRELDSSSASAFYSYQRYEGSFTDQNFRLVYVHQYYIDLSNLVSEGGPEVCITEFHLFDLGKVIEAVDYDSNNVEEYGFVNTNNWPYTDTIAPTSITRSGDKIVFSFSRPLCPGEISSQFGLTTTSTSAYYKAQLFLTNDSFDNSPTCEYRGNS